MAFFSKMDHFERNLQTNNSAEFVERMVKDKKVNYVSSASGCVLSQT